MFKSYYATSIVALLVMLSACGGGGGSDNPPGSDNETSILFTHFRSDQGVVISSASASATLTENSEYSSVSVVNDPGVGDEQVISPASGKSLFFDYDFQKENDDQDEFGVFLVDVTSGSSLSESAEFFVQEAGANEASIDLSNYVDTQIGVQFQLASLPGDAASGSSVVIKNIRIK